MYRSSSLPSGWGPFAGGLGLFIGCLIGLIISLAVKFGSKDSENPPPENINLRILGAVTGIVVGLIMVFTSSFGDMVSLSSKLDQKVSLHIADTKGYKNDYYIVQNDLTTKPDEFEYRVPLGEYLNYTKSQFGDVFLLKGTGPKYAVHDLVVDWILSMASKSSDKKMELKDSSKDTSYLRQLLESEEEDQEYLIVVPSFEHEYYMVWDKASIPVMLESQGYNEEQKAEFYARYGNDDEDDNEGRVIVANSMFAFYFILGEKHDSNGIILNAGTENPVYYSRRAVAGLFNELISSGDDESENE